MDSRRRVGIAAVLAGGLFFVGQGGELVLGDDSRGIFVVLVAALGVAILAFGVAFHGLRDVLSGSRAGRVGASIGLAGSAFLVAFAVQLSAAAATTGEVPENFILFAVGFLLVFAAHLVIARPLRVLVGSAWWVSLVAAAALLLALVVNEVFIWHDLALFVFEGCWVAFGVLLVRQTSVTAAEVSTA
jgi:hypothetical protein